MLDGCYIQHYSIVLGDENTRVYTPKLPTHRQVSLPVSLPVDQRLFLYIRDGEVFARC